MSFAKATAELTKIRKIRSDTVLGHPIFRRREAIERYENAPVRGLRTLYLEHLSAQGTSIMRLRALSSTLLNVVHLLDFTVPRQIAPAEIEEAADRWAMMTSRPIEPGAAKHGRRLFVSSARGFLRFCGFLIEAREPMRCFETEFQDYLAGLTVEQSLAPTTTTVYRRRVEEFLRWLLKQKCSLASLSVQDVDDYFDYKRTTSRQTTIVSLCNALRSFLGYAATRGWCHWRIRSSVRPPSVHRSETAAIGPCWSDVQTLLASAVTGRACDLRARAIFVLCAIYGLRCSEVARLCLDDFDWRGSTFRVIRSKNKRTQRFPIQNELGEAVIVYLKTGRPLCGSRSLFVTLSPPYRELSPHVLSQMVAKRMAALSIPSKRAGAHALRHACATQLLRTGSSLQEIADFLGHSGLGSVSIYAKHDTESMREIADFSLRDVL